jgi:hypothetical protein
METLAFVGVALFIALFLEGCLLALPGFSGALLFVVGAGFAVYFWPTIPARIMELRELHKFRKELDNHGQD